MLGALCGCKVRCYVQAMVRFLVSGAVLSAMVGCKVKVLGLVRCGCQTNQARAWSILQPKVWLWCGGRVRCGYILHPSFSLVLGLVLRKRIKSKE